MNLTQVLEQLEVGDEASFMDYAKAASVRVLCNRIAKLNPGRKFKSKTHRDTDNQRYLIVARVA